MSSTAPSSNNVQRVTCETSICETTICTAFCSYNCSPEINKVSVSEAKPHFRSHCVGPFSSRLPHISKLYVSHCWTRVSSKDK